MRLRKLVVYPLWLAVLMALVAGLSLFAAVYTYQRLSDEEPVARLIFQQLDEDQYRVSVSSGDFCDVREYLIHGDQWRLDARFLKWKPWANLMGLDAQYRLDRLSGRYRDVDEETAGPHTAYALSEKPWLDIERITRALGEYNFLVDTQFGSSAYEDIDTERVYTIYRGQSGLVARSEARAGARFDDGVLTIDIRSACEKKRSWWRDLIGN